MFTFRSDGKKVKGIDPIKKIVPYIMFERNDSQNLYVESLNCEAFDKFIQEKRAEGISYNYMHLVIATVVRLMATRTELNRFIMNGRMYQRYSKDGRNIAISLTVKKFLNDETEDTTLKMLFNGHETLKEIKDIIDTEIKANTSFSRGNTKNENSADKTAKFLTSIPGGLVKFAVKTVKWMDKHCMMPKSILRVSPFHSSCYITNLKSIKTNYIYHHLYNFGTTSMFISMGKEHEEPVVSDNGTIEIQKIMRLGFTIDERITDGFYYAKSLKIFKDILMNPAQLEESI